MPLELEDEDEPSFAELTELSCDETQSGVLEVVTRDVTGDRTAHCVLGSPVPSPPSDCPNADEGSEDFELDDSVSQKPMSVFVVVGCPVSITP